MDIVYTNKWIKQVFYLLFILITAKSIAQSDASYLPKITPPSPTAGELGKYGNVPVGMFTGASNISIPLISFKAKELESPMSLYYGSNGIKVDEVASNVGLGWNFNFGGVITRTVRDKPDVVNSVYAPDNINTATYEAKMQFYKTVTGGNADTERDLYSFNFNGNSGKFVYDKNGMPILTSHQKIKIERIGINNADFLITTTDGVKYFFTEQESSMMRSSGEGHSVPMGGITAWYLSKMIHPNGAEIYLMYEGTHLDYVASNSQTFIMSYPAFQSGCNGVLQTVAPTLSGIVSHTMTVVGKRVNKIYSNNSIDGYVTIVYNTAGVNEDIAGNSTIETITQHNAAGDMIEKIRFNYLNTTNKRIFLQGISFLIPGKNYSFEYINPSTFPTRLSTSQDHWGYYNGKDNINLVPKNIADYDLNNIEYYGADKEPNGNLAKIGLLNKIIYPTKGYTEFDYESNTYWGEKTTYPKKTKLILKKTEKETNSEAKTINITSPIDQTIELMGRVVYAGDGPAPKWGENDPKNTGHYSASMRITCTDPSEDCPRFYEDSSFGSYPHDGGFVFLTSSDKDNPIVDNKFYFDAKAGKTYTLHLSKNGNGASAMVDITYYATASVTISTNVETGGVRIKSTKDSPEASGKANYKRYYYGPKENLNKSSGDKGNDPFYIDFSTRRQMCTSEWSMGICVYTDFKSLVLTSSSMISLFNTGNSNCFYKYVTVSDGGDDFENGGESKEFIIHRDYWGQTVLGDTDIQSAPWTNFGWDNGLEVKSQIFKKPSGNSFVVVAENENRYKLDSSHNKEVLSYSVRKNFEQLCHNSIDNFSIVAYKTLSHWFYLETSISKKYDLNGLNPIETRTDYGYNNSTHLQLTSQSITNSKSEKLETKYFYPQDSQMASEPFVKELIAQNRISSPLDVQTFRRGIKLSERKTVYDKSTATSNLLLPKTVLENKGTVALNSVTDKKISYDFYDDRGNLLQYTQDGGTPTSIVWGYNKTLPVAKVDNIAYKNIQTYLVNGVQNASSWDKGTEGDMIIALNRFWYGYSGLYNTLITTYAYKPLVGISRMRDINGTMTYYDYDDFNRLKFVKDNDQNVLQAYFYNYKGQVMDISLDVAPVYRNTAISKTFYRANCSSGLTGPLVYSVSAGTYTSVISQQDADNKALNDMNMNGQVNANRNGYCAFWNKEKSGVFTKNNCASGTAGTSVVYTVPAMTSYSLTSQAAADEIAQISVNKNGQAYANANGSCMYLSNELSGYLNMFSEYLGMVKVAYIVPAGEFSSTISQDDADNQAQEGLSQCWQEFSCSAEQYQDFAPNIPPNIPPNKIPDFKGYDCKNVVFTIMQPSYETN